MPAGPFEARCERTLEDISTISQRIRRSALAFKRNQASDRSFNAAEKLRRLMETIHVSCNAMLETIALETYATDGRIMDWLLSGEPRMCLGRLKEMEDLLKPDSKVPPLAQPFTSSEDRLTAATSVSDEHHNLFHFLLTPDVWNREHHHQPPQHETLPVSDTQHNPQGTRSVNTLNSAATRHEHSQNRPASTADQRLITKGKMLFQQKMDAVFRWLAPLDCVEKHKQTLQLRQEGTCMWLPKTDAYRKWRTGGNQYLWLHGKAGCGKSVSIASTIEHLKNTLRDDEVIVYFYCDFRNERSTIHTELMRSLLSQLSRHFCGRAIDPGDFPNKILEAKCKGTLSLDNLEKLSDLVMRATLYFPCNPIIVIDVLDECADIEALVHALARFKRSQADVRLLVTSRPHQTIMDHLVEFQSLSFEDMEEELAGDIALHVTRVVGSDNRLGSADPQMKEEIHAKLSERAEGRFRWVQCQLDNLRRRTSWQELKEALNNLPKGLGVTYERILGEIDERKLEGKLARRTLAWLMVALEPLQLARIVDGLLADPHQRAIDRRTLGTALLNALSSLVSYSEETDVLALSHFSVKEYLMCATALPAYQITPHEAHIEASRTCMEYISMFLKQGPFRANVAPLQSFPLLSYVLSLGFNHLAHVDPGSTVVLEALRSLGADVRHYPSHWERLCELREEHLGWPYPPWPSSRHDFVPYILIAYSSTAHLQSFVSSGGPLKPRLGTNPLVYAADLRKTEHALALLSCGADVNVLGFVIDDSRHAFPLDIAIDAGDDVLVGKLLRRGCMVTSETLTTAVCMPWCSTPVLVKLMQTGEFVEWARTIGDEKLYRSVFSSARPNAGDNKKADEDHVTLARILHQIGYHLSADSQFGAELIERAVYAAHTSMLEFLLPPDQPPHPRFLLAASTGNTSETVSVVRFLLCRGVDTHAVSDGRRDTALHLAVMCPWEPRRLELTRLLIDGGCGPHAQNSRGETPLTIAAGRGYTSVVELLLSCSDSFPSNMHSTTSNGDTLLHASMIKYDGSRRLDLVKILIEAGCCPTTVNSQGKSILDAAIERGHTSVVECLLSHNVPLPPDILSSALRRHSPPHMVEFLIRKGVDVHSTTSNGDTLFHLSMTKYDESRRLDVVNIFIDAGCNLTTVMGKSILDAAIERGHTPVVECLLSRNVPFPPDTLLFALRRHSPPHMVEFLIRKGVGIHSTTSNGDTLLHFAMTEYGESRRLDVVRIFIEAGCNPTTVNFEGKSSLEVAIERGHTSVVECLLLRNIPFPPDILLFALRRHSSPHMLEFLIRRGAAIHSTTFNGDTLLHLAMTEYDEARRLDLVKIFIEAGCNPTIINSEGKSSLEAAIERGHTLVVEFLLSRNVPFPPDVLLFALRQRSPFHIVEFLIRKGVDVHFTTSNGDTVLHLAVTRYHGLRCLDLVKVFIEAGCDPTTINSLGKSSLEAAIERGHTSVVECLLSRKVPFPRDILLNALLRHSPVHMVEFLVGQGVDLHSIASNGDTALHLAMAEYSESRCLDLVKILIAAGCNPTTTNSQGKSSLEAAIERGYTSVVELLLSHKVPFPPDVLLFALRRHSPPRMVEFLIRKGVGVRSTMSTEDTLLHLAMTEYNESSRLDLVKIFIEAGCKPTVCDSVGKSILGAAIDHGYTSVVELLHSCWNVPFYPNILLFALSRRAPPHTVKFLIRKGADVRSTMSNGDTVLHLAIAEYAQGACCFLVKDFIKAGSNPAACNSQGRTVLEAAIERGYTFVVELLLSHSVPFPLDSLLFALRQRHCTSQMVHMLVRNSADIPMMLFRSNWDKILQLVHASYPGQDCQQVIEMLDAARKACRTCPSPGPGDETPVHVAKKPRLE